MAILSKFTVSDLENMSRAMRTLNPARPSMASMASEVTGFLHQNLLDEEGRPACALVRIYVTQPIRALPAPHAEAAHHVDADADATTTCLVALASNGEIDRPVGGPAESWVVPFTNTAFAQVPMMPRLLEKVGLDLDAACDTTRAIATLLQQRTFSVYLATDFAADELLIPKAEHRQLVRERGVKSLVALAGVLPTGDVLMLILQARVAVSEEIAELLRPLAVGIKASLIPYSRTIF